jgi:hypothetical protein
MNAPLSIPASAQGDLEEFVECCEVHAWFFAEGWISLQTAVDNLQALAERWGLISLHGQDAVQQIIAGPATIQAGSECRSADDIVRGWELADRRDRWKHTGELPPAPEVIPTVAARSHRLPSSTVDAFKHVVSLGDPVVLSKWLRDHSDVAPALLKEVA